MSPQRRRTLITWAAALALLVVLLASVPGPYVIHGLIAGVAFGLLRGIKWLMGDYRR